MWLGTITRAKSNLMNTFARKINLFSVGHSLASQRMTSSALAAGPLRYLSWSTSPKKLQNVHLSPSGLSYVQNDAKTKQAEPASDEDVIQTPKRKAAPAQQQSVYRTSTMSGATMTFQTKK